MAERPAHFFEKAFTGLAAMLLAGVICSPSAAGDAWVECRPVQSPHFPVIVTVVFKNPSEAETGFWHPWVGDSPSSSTFYGEVEDPLSGVVKMMVVSSNHNYCGSGNIARILPGSEVRIPLILTKCKERGLLHYHSFILPPVHWSYRPGRYLFRIVSKGNRHGGLSFPKFVTESRSFTIASDWTADEPLRKDFEGLSQEFRDVVREACVTEGTIHDWAANLTGENLESAAMNVWKIEKLTAFSPAHSAAFIQALIFWHRQAHSSTRTHCMGSLLRLVGMHPRRENVPVIVSLLKKEKDRLTKFAFCRALERNGGPETGKELILLWRDEEDPEVKREMVWAMETCRCESVVAFLTGLLSDDDEETRKAAACSLAVHGVLAGVESLARTVGESGGDLSVLCALWKSPSPRAQSVLTDLLARADPETRQRYARYLEHLRDYDE